MEVETEAEAPPPELAAVLEHATLMAKQLPSAADSSQLLQIHAALHAAHHRLSLFLSHHPPPQPENSVSSAVGGEPMQMEDDEEEQNSRAAVEKVAWRMRECFIQNKRPKRHLSPSAEQRRSFEDEADAAPEEFDPLRTKLRALELIQQFHA
ncbi:hypothetical protein AAHA92_16920 [Salvia divinorum]|uniref:Uncharacterized protein n=1 Tax=Salvia divinorum TaxID=28513 RepID=A0ABD1H0B1_SALDI